MGLKSIKVSFDSSIKAFHKFSFLQSFTNHLSHAGVDFFLDILMIAKKSLITNLQFLYSLQNFPILYLHILIIYQELVITLHKNLNYHFAFYNIMILFLNTLFLAHSLNLLVLSKSLLYLKNEIVLFTLYQNQIIKL